MATKIYVHDGTRSIPLAFSTTADADAFRAWFRATDAKAMHWHDDLSRLLTAFGEGVTTDEAVRRLDALYRAFTSDDEHILWTERLTGAVYALFAPLSQ